jgi:hypothetical protein
MMTGETLVSPVPARFRKEGERPVLQHFPRVAGSATDLLKTDGGLPLGGAAGAYLIPPNMVRKGLPGAAGGTFLLDLPRIIGYVLIKSIAWH